MSVEAQVGLSAEQAERLLRQYERERSARKHAVALFEEQSRALNQANQQLQAQASELECMVARRTEELQSALHAAEDALRARQEFLAVISHEIRTPMNGVLGMAEVLAGTALDADQARYLGIIRSSGEVLLSLINDILDYSRIESGKLELDHAPVDPSAIVSDIAALFSGQARSRGLEVTHECDASVPAWMAGDGIRLRQIISNLVGNAVKFTRKGGVHIRLTMRDPDTLECAVSDTGIGIAQDQMERLFQVFSQVDSSIRREFGGTGLGLAISRRLVLAMGGDITVQSQLGSGSTFSFHLPVERVAAPRPLAAHTGTFVQLRGLRVLVVEDNPVNQMLAEITLAKLGAEVDLADDGEAGVELARSGSYHYILMDMQMPGMDGIAAAALIRKLPDIRQPRIIALTANAGEADRRACLEAGMDDFLSKPFKSWELAAKLSMLS